MADEKLYKAKSDSNLREERSGAGKVNASSRLRFLMRKHDDTRLNYDLRLERKDVLKSWAITREPSLDPHHTRLTLEIEYHPLNCGDFEGTTPKVQYGAGTVMLWDRGYWASEEMKAAQQAFKVGDPKCTLEGKRLHCSFIVIRVKHDRNGGKLTNWLLIKPHDAHAVDSTGDAILDDAPSVAHGRTMDIIAAGKGSMATAFMIAGDGASPNAVWKSLLELVEVPGDRKPYFQTDQIEGLAAVAQVAALEIRPWNCEPGQPEVPGRLAFDLDIGPDVPFSTVVKAAKEMRDLLVALGLMRFCKRTGGKGLHVVTPVGVAKQGRLTLLEATVFAHHVCLQMAREESDRYLVKMTKKLRSGRTFLNYLRNDRMATAVAKSNEVAA